MARQTSKRQNMDRAAIQARLAKEPAPSTPGEIEACASTWLPARRANSAATMTEDHRYQTVVA
jgi:hypothetical protein